MIKRFISNWKAVMIARKMIQTMEKEQDLLLIEYKEGGELDGKLMGKIIQIQVAIDVMTKNLEQLGHRI